MGLLPLWHLVNLAMNLLKWILDYIYDLAIAAGIDPATLLNSILLG